MGKRISAVKKASCHPDVDIYFLPNAWADANFCEQWVKKTLKPVVEGRFVIFLYNLEGQIADEFKQEVAKAGGICSNGLKVKVRQAHYQWLDWDENVNKWYREENHFTASERQILITHWVGEAYKALLEATYDTFEQEIFERTGCFLTADGSRDNLVQPEGLPHYRIPPPAIIEPSPQYAASSNPGGVTRKKDCKN